MENENIGGFWHFCCPGPDGMQTVFGGRWINGEMVEEYRYDEPDPFPFLRFEMTAEDRKRFNKNLGQITYKDGKPIMWERFPVLPPKTEDNVTMD